MRRARRWLSMRGRRHDGHDSILTAMERSLSARNVAFNRYGLGAQTDLCLWRSRHAAYDVPPDLRLGLERERMAVEQVLGKIGIERADVCALEPLRRSRRPLPAAIPGQFPCRKCLTRNRALFRSARDRREVPAEPMAIAVLVNAMVEHLNCSEQLNCQSDFHRTCVEHRQTLQPSTPAG